MPIDITQYFQKTRDLVAVGAQDFSLPNCRSLIVVKRQQGGQTLYWEINPRPMIETVNPRLVELYEDIEGIELELDDLSTKISAAYTEAQIVGRGISYVVDGELVDGKPVGGFEADKVTGTNITRRDLHWEIILRRRP